MENCEHTTHHNDCCVCWFKQSYDRTYDGDIPLFMDKMAALLLGVSWKDYCMRKALGSAKDAFEEIYNDGDIMIVDRHIYSLLGYSGGGDMFENYTHLKNIHV